MRQPGGNSEVINVFNVTLVKRLQITVNSNNCYDNDVDDIKCQPEGKSNLQIS